MDDSPLSEVLILCQEVTNENKTDDLYSTLEVFLMKNYAKIAKEASRKRSSKRRVYGKMESTLVDYFMRLCKYACSRSNIQRVHRIMMILGFSGYEYETRFRQRTENTLKKWKKQGRRVPSAKKRMSSSFEQPIRKSCRSARFTKPCVRSSSPICSEEKDMEEVNASSSQNDDGFLQQEQRRDEECEPSSAVSQDLYSSPASLSFTPLDSANDCFANYESALFNSDPFSTPSFDGWDFREEFFLFGDREGVWTGDISDPSLG